MKNLNGNSSGTKGIAVFSLQDPLVLELEVTDWLQDHADFVELVDYKFSAVSHDGAIIYNIVLLYEELEPFIYDQDTL